MWKINPRREISNVEGKFAILAMMAEEDIG